MSGAERQSATTRRDGVAIETYVDGEGPPFVILPSYGRDGGEDFDDLTRHLVDDGWQVLRPQPRGIAGSTGPMEGQSLHDLATDIATVIRELADAPAVILGHAFGNQLARVLVTDHPGVGTAVILAAAGSSGASKEVNDSPFVAGDLSRLEAERLAVLRSNFFAPQNDARIWLSGWYPDTLRMEHEAAQATDLKAVSKCGSVPILQLVAEYDPFNPPSSWGELKDQIGLRVTQAVIGDASHALFPEQPAKVAEAVLPWAQRWR